MAAEKIELFELDIDMDALIEKSARTEKNIIGIKSEIKDLKDDFKEGSISSNEYSKSFVQLNAQLKTNQKEQRTQTKLIQAYSDQQNKAINIIKQTDGSINQINAALGKNRELYRNLSKEQRESSEIGEELASVIAEQDAEYKRLSKSIGNNQVEVGNYKNQMKEAINETGGFNRGINVLGKGLKSLGIIGLIVGLLDKLVGRFEQNQKVADFFSTAINAITIVLDDLISFAVDNVSKISDVFKNPTESLKTLGNLIVQNIIERFNSAIEAAGFLGSAIAKVFKGDFEGAINDAGKAGAEFVDVLTGVDGTLNKTSETVSKYAKETFNAAQAQTELANASELNEIQQQRIIQRLERRAEKERQIRDDVSLSNSERIEANERLGKILEEQAEKELGLINSRVQLARLNVQQNDNIENQIALNEALLSQEDTLNRIEGQRSEQLTNRVALEQEEIERIREFENKKREIRNQLDLENELTEQQKEGLRIEQEFLKEQEELERLRLTEDEKTELLKLIEEQRGEAIEAVREKMNDKLIETQKKLYDENLKNAEAAAQAEAQIQRELVGILTGILGEGLGAQLAGIALEALVNAAQVKGATAAASVQNLAAATASAPPPFNAPFIAAAIGQNAALQATAAKQLAVIGSTAAIGATKAIVGQGVQGFATGGRVNSSGNIRTQPNGDNVLATLKTGEVVLNSAQQRALGGASTFRSIGVPGFASGGVVGGSSTTINNNNMNIQELAAEIANANAALPNPVVFVEEINTGQDRVAQVEEVGNF